MAAKSSRPATTRWGPSKNITEWATYQGFAGYNRDGQAYLINTRGQEVAKGRYQGWEFRVRGQRYFFLEQDKSWQDGGRFWTLVDTGGRPLLLPLSRPSFLKGVSPAGLALVAYADSKPGSQPEVAALDTRGRPVLSNLGELSAWHGLVLARHPAADGATRFFDASGQPLPVEQLFQVRLLPPSQRPLDWTAQQPNHWRGRLLSIVAEADKRTLGYLTRGRRLWED